MLLKGFAFDLIPTDQAIALLRDQAAVHRQTRDYCVNLKASSIANSARSRMARSDAPLPP